MRGHSPRGRRAATLLHAPVFVRGIRLGEVENVLLDAEALRILGLEVLCGDGRNRFLPYATVRLAGEAIEIDSALTLLDQRLLDFYRSRGRTLTAAPELADALIQAEGALVLPLTPHC